MAQNIPSEEQVLKALKQQAQRKAYQQSPKAKQNRKAYQQKRQAEAKIARDFIKNNPDMVAKLANENPELKILVANGGQNTAEPAPATNKKK